MRPRPGAPGSARMARLRLGGWIMSINTNLLTPTAAERADQGGSRGR